MSNHLLELVDVAKEYESRGDAGRQHMRALDGVNFVVNEQETVGVVGESGCGKTTLAKIVMGVITPTEGRVLLDGEDLSEGSRKRARERRRHVQMVFQNPYSSIDPRFTILKCVAEPLQTHTDLRGEALEMRVRELLDWVGMPGDLLTRYSHELSGGQLQRVAVARALVLEPRLVVLDEPTSALDVSVQAQILNLLNELRASRNLAYLFISHDLSVIRHVCDWVVVMYLGRVVEMNTTDAIFSEETKHPYTEVLLSSMPSLVNLGRPYRRPESKALGQAHHGKGCSYAPRCPLTIERCWTEVPQLNSKGTGHPVACHVLNDGEE